MKKFVCSLLLFLLMISHQATAGNGHHHNGSAAVFYDHGRVIRVEPIYGHRPQLNSGIQCFQQQRHHNSYHRRNNNSLLPTAAGAIVGGVVGHSLGKKRNKRAATAAGAVIGGVIGHHIGQSQTPKSYQHNQSSYCVNTHERSRRNTGNGKRAKNLNGYLVTYRYKGEKFTTYTREHPGHRIPLEVRLRPAGFR